VAFALSAIPSSAHIEDILKNILGDWCKPFRGATLRQTCDIIMERELGEVGVENGSYTTCIGTSSQELP
jgi:hypothetical protein